MNNTIYTIDAEGKKIGRVATLAAMHLMGKSSPTYKRNAITGEKVVIKNASKVIIDAPKLTDKKYQRYSGYPGGLKERSLKEVIARKGMGYREVFKKAVHGMLPANRLRPKIMKNLEIAD